MSEKTPVVEIAYFDPAETMPRGALEALQLERLRQTVARCAKTPFYRDALARARVTPDDLRSLDDLRRLPFTTKADFRAHYPLGLMAVPREEVVRFHGSSGTTGQPTFVAYTRNDLDMWANCCARFLVAGGLKPEHVVQVSFGYGLFTGGFGLHYGIEKAGAAVVPVGAGNSERQMTVMRDLAVDVLICTPSYALALADDLAARKGPPLSLKYAHLGGEPWTESMRASLEKALPIRCFNNYGLSEVLGPGVSGECGYRDGMHVSEDHFIVECVDPDTLEPVPDGEEGELVVTNLTREAMPVLRYRTRDLARIWRTPCPCGRTGIRHSRIVGRTDDMLIVRGVNLYPSQVETALLRVAGISPHYLIEVDRPGTLDEIAVRVEVMPDTRWDNMRVMQALRDEVHDHLASVTGLRFKVELSAPGTLERFMGKAKRVTDRRGIKG